MKTETVTVSPSNKEKLDVCRAFGYEVTGEERRKLGPHHRTLLVLSRKSNIAHYSELAELERKYDAYEAQIVKYEKPDISTYLILYLLFILPGIIFTVYQKTKEMDITAANDELKAKMDNLVSIAEELRNQK